MGSSQTTGEESAYEIVYGPSGPSPAQMPMPTWISSQIPRTFNGISLSHVRIIAWSFLPQHCHRLHVDNIISTCSVNQLNQPGELEKMEFQQAQTRLLSAMFRRNDITQRECGWDDTAMT